VKRAHELNEVESWATEAGNRSEVYEYLGSDMLVV